MTRLALIVDHEACWGCLACEVACKLENGVAPGLKFIRVGEDGTATAAMARRFADAGVDTVVLLAIGAGDGDHDGPFGTVRATAARLGLS